jgi:GT2 family glycosyltransferase
MPEPPAIYAVILNWNRADLTIRCVESIISACPQVGIIIVDNGSTDDSVMILKARFPDITIIENGANLGFGAGNNPGIRYALEHKAQYVWLLNNDIIIESGSLPAMLDKFAENTDVGIVGSAVCDMANPESLLALGGGMIKPGRSFAVHCVSPADIEHLSYITGSSMLIKAEVLDADLCLRAKNSGYSLCVAEKSRILHENGASSNDSALKSYQIFKSGLYFHRKHFSTIQVISYILCFIADVICRDILTFKWSHALKLIKLFTTNGNFDNGRS